ncbi:MAG: hypothetical protein U5R31_00490 [Acidimicrobiia bacterium]|nr:hypothetical protein [Acidimicrobiia bacterium]
MAHLLVVAPFVELARATDPLELGRRDGGLVSLAEVRDAATARVRELVASVVGDAPTTGRVDQRWYWAAPLLADLTGPAGGG